MRDLGWRVDPVPGLEPWLTEARRAADRALETPVPDQMRHGGTWYVGLEALGNDPGGQIGTAQLPLKLPPLHSGQISVVWPGYPKDDGTESPSAARFRRKRDGAHVDGLHPVGPDRRRKLREPHSFILGLPLDETEPGASPLAVYEGSHRIIGAALGQQLRHHPVDDWPQIDLTEAYTAARRTAFETCPRVEVMAKPGEAIWLHRHMLHGIAPWTAPDGPPRRVVYFRPELREWAAWLSSA